MNAKEPHVSTDEELAEWIAEGDAESAREQAERKQAERQLRGITFEHAKYALRCALYAKAISQ